MKMTPVYFIADRFGIALLGHYDGSSNIRGRDVGWLLGDIHIPRSEPRHHYLTQQYESARRSAQSSGIIPLPPESNADNRYNLFHWLGVLYARDLGTSTRTTNEMAASFLNNIYGIFAETIPDAAIPGTDWHDLFRADYRRGFEPERDRLLTPARQAQVVPGPPPPPDALHFTPGRSTVTRNSHQLAPAPGSSQLRSGPRTRSPSAGPVLASNGSSRSSSRNRPVRRYGIEALAFQDGMHDYRRHWTTQYGNNHGFQAVMQAFGIGVDRNSQRYRELERQYETAYQAGQRDPLSVSINVPSPARPTVAEQIFHQLGVADRNHSPESVVGDFNAHVDSIYGASGANHTLYRVSAHALGGWFAQYRRGRLEEPPAVGPPPGIGTVASGDLTACIVASPYR